MTNESAARRIRVMTYNIHKGFSTANRRFVLHQIRDQLRQADVDLVFLQEIQGEHTRKEKRVEEWPDASQFEFLADEIWQHHAYGKNAIYNAGHHGNAILSKYPFVQWENINVSALRRASRSILHGVIHLPESMTNIHVVCIHLDFVATERLRQIDILNARIREHVPDDEPLILAGDFNDWSGRLDRHLADDLQLVDPYLELHRRHARTYPSWFPMLPVDRIYYRGLAPVEADCFQEPPWHRLSDHVPLYASFELTGNNDPE